MRLFFKCAMTTLGIQVALLLFLGIVGNSISVMDSLFDLFLRIYEPMIIVVARLGRFRGESAMIEPVWIGIALGALFYSLIFGFAGLFLKRGR